MATTYIKGDNFTYSGALEATENGVALPSLVGWTGEAVVQRQDGRRIAVVTFAWLDASQRLAKISALPAATVNWPEGLARLIVRLTSPTGERVSALPTEFQIVGGINDA